MAEESSPAAPAARDVLVARGLHGVGTKRSSSAKAAMERSFAQLTPDENEDEDEEDDEGPVLHVLLSLARAADSFPLALLSVKLVLDPCASSALTRDEDDEEKEEGEEEEEDEEEEDRSMDREEGGG